MSKFRQSRVAAPCKRVVLEGSPRIGKTTLVRKVADRFIDAGIPVMGFTTQEMRDRGERVGFKSRTFDGKEAVIAHVDLETGPRVARYCVDINAIEEILVPELDVMIGDDGKVISVLDEIGMMQILAPGFFGRVERLFACGGPLIATVHSTTHAASDRIKIRHDVDRIYLTKENRNSLLTQVYRRFI